MRWEWEVVIWAAIALLLMAAEALVPGAFMLWLGFAAAAVFVLVLVVPDVPVVALDGAIVNGQGRVQIADAYWSVTGPDLPAGTAVRVVGSEGMTLRVEA